jgi:hypothetical protein
MILCPSTPFFLLSLVTFIGGITKLNALHTEDVDVGAGYCYVLTANLISIDWRNIIASLQMFLPIGIWAMTMIAPVIHWCLKMCFPGQYRRYQDARRLRAEESRRKRESVREKERDGDMEQGAVPLEGEADEETPLRSKEERVGLDS